MTDTLETITALALKHRSCCCGVILDDLIDLAGAAQINAAKVAELTPGDRAFVDLAQSVSDAVDVP